VSSNFGKPLATVAGKHKILCQALLTMYISFGFKVATGKCASKILNIKHVSLNGEGTFWYITFGTLVQQIQLLYW